MTDSNLQNNAVVASSASQWISIVPENGETFNPQQKIIYNIEPELGFIKKDSYLVFDVVNTASDQGRWAFQKNLGCHAIIDKVDIFSKETGVLLESNTHYSQWANIEHQYLFDDHSNLQNHQGVGTPVQSWTHQLSHTNVKTTHRSVPSVKDIQNNYLSPVGKIVDNGGAPAYTSRRFCIPLKCGVFGHFDSVEKAIPVMNFGGLRVEITLAKPERALQRMVGNIKTNTWDSKDNDRPFFDWVAGVPIFGDTVDRTGAVDDFVFTITMGTNSTDGIRTDTLQDVGLVVGNSVKIVGTAVTGGAAFTTTGVVKTIAVAATNDVIINGTTTTLTRSLTITITQPAAAIGPVGGLATGALSVVGTPNYKVMKSEFRLLQIVPPPQVADSLTKGINYEFLTYDCFFDNIPTAPLRHQIPIHSVASKAVATFTQLYATSNDEGQEFSASDYYAGALPTEIKLNDVVYFINNRLYPLRSYNPQALSDKVLTQNELVKAFRAIGKQPLSLGNADYGDLQSYTNTPLISRELAREGMVFDLRNAEPELRVAFSEARASILRANTFVFSKKIIQTTATGVQVIH